MYKIPYLKKGKLQKEYGKKQKNGVSEIGGKIIGNEDRPQRSRWFDENVK
jgi:hypothetical protein